ncbi:hypothetical protein CDAR_8161 [Caerostris darwini]|uniref:Uncharacterized protein n=1 Tax=Caerostris darwini TaxID=1538125 RepID=A0AAV4SXP0_9ARAC|nr:hypothetical protein CDAR_8161 [Caerostris darwini]
MSHHLATVCGKRVHLEIYHRQLCSLFAGEELVKHAMHPPLRDGLLCPGVELALDLAHISQCALNGCGNNYAFICLLDSTKVADGAT